MKSGRPLADEECLGSSASVCDHQLFMRVDQRGTEKTARNVGKLGTAHTQLADGPLSARGNKCEGEGTQKELAKGRSRTPGGRWLPGKTVAFGEEHLFKGDIDNYVLGQQIGQGAYATVRLSTQKSSNTKVAIKVYDKSRISEPHRRRNLIREIEIMLRLDHPNCVKLVEAVNAGKQVFLVMEYVAGESLHACLKQRQYRRMEESEARGVFGQVVAGLQYVHAMSIAHRDIKLENIIMDDLHCVKIIDFGFSTLSPVSEKAKVFCGTPSYMSPEIVLRKEYAGQAADMWALGVLLFALLSGTFPFRGLSDKELYAKITKGLFNVPHCISPLAKGLIQSLLSVDPAKRPTCSEILQHAWVTNAPVSVLSVKDTNVSENRPAKNSPVVPRKSMLSALFQKYQIFRKPEGGFTYTKLHTKGKENRE